MCLKKIYVRDLYRPGHIGNYFPCGRCKSCRQQSAERRARRIRYHHPKGYHCYFITLGYINEYVPYVLRSDVFDVEDQLILTPDSQLSVPVYRDYDIRHRRSFSYRYKVNKPISYQRIKKSSTYDQLEKLSGLRKKISSDKYIYDDSKISVCLNSDIQKFFKRLRTNLFRSFGENISLSYYNAPEYGPTTQRFHIHLLVWFPSFLSYSQICNHVSKAWPYADKDRTNKFIEYARCPSNYLASYVNSGDNVSTYLTDNFRLRPSHSLDFGFGSDIFDFPKVFKQFRDGHYKYPTVRTNQFGQVEECDVYYPKYITSRYFPKFKGYNRLTRSTLLHAYQSPESYFRLYRRLQAPPSPSGQLNYYCDLVDGLGNRLFFTESESRYTIMRINRAYSYFASLCISRFDFALYMIEFNDSLYRQYYKESQSSLDPLTNALQFYNIPLLFSGEVHNDSIEDLICDKTLDDVHPNSLPFEVLSDDYYTTKYNRNIKQRKINAL